MSSGLGPELPGDPDDPYAPPRAELGAARPPAAIGIVPYELGPILQATWVLYRANLGPCLAVGWTVIGFLLISQYLQRLVSQDLSPDPADRFAYFLAQFGSFFVSWVFNSWVTIGQNLALLALARNARPVFPRIFQGFPFLLTTLLAGILFALTIGMFSLLFLIWIPILGGILGPGNGAVMLVQGAGLVLALTTAIYIGTRLSQYHLMIVDHHAGIMDSLRYSWQATEHRIGTLLLVWLLLLTINLAGLLACFVGLLFTVPFTNLLLIVTYLSLTGQPVGASRKDHTTEIEFVE